jgi:hypothetical protein
MLRILLIGLNLSALALIACTPKADKSAEAPAKEEAPVEPRTDAGPTPQKDAGQKLAEKPTAKPAATLGK